MRKMTVSEKAEKSVYAALAIAMASGKDSENMPL